MDTKNFCKAISTSQASKCYLIYEWNLGALAYNFSPDLHFPSESFEVEHIFAGKIHENISFEPIGGFRTYSLEDEDDFRRTLLNRSGNLLFLPQASNQ